MKEGLVAGIGSKRRVATRSLSVSIISGASAPALPRPVTVIRLPRARAQRLRNTEATNLS